MIDTLSRALTSSRGQWWLLFAGAVESTALLAVLAIPPVALNRLAALRTTGVLLTAAAATLSFLVLPSSVWLARSRLLRWLARDARILAFIPRLSACVLAGLAAFVVYKLLLDGVAAFAGSPDPYAGMSKPIAEADVGTFIVGIGLLAAWPVCMYLFILGQAGALAFALTGAARLRGIFLRER
jgi:hypothetical protein